MSRSCLLSLALFAAPAFAGEPPPPPVVTETPRPAAVKPAEIVAAVGRAVRLSAGDGTTPVRWELATETDCDLVPLGRTAVFAAEKPGRYLVLCYTAAAGEPSAAARTVVVVGNAPPPAPGPTPGPVVPPAPPPDPLRAKLRAAYLADAGTAADKADAAADLAALYRQAKALAADPEVATTSALAERLRKAAESLVGPNRLTGVRRAIAAEVVALFPADAPLTADARAKAADLFARVEAACKEMP